MAVQVRPTAFKMFLLYLIPKNWLSRLVGWAVRRRWPFGLHLRIRNAFIRAYAVNVSEAEKPLDEYPTLGDFFIRRLKPGTRPLTASALVSPVDGMLTQRGGLETGSLRLTQIKGISYDLQALAGAGWDVSPYAGGAFLTFYLAPWNYHRIHAPAAGQVKAVRHIAGALWPVNRWSVETIPELFVRNDRILVEMECPLWPEEGDGSDGKILIAMVGATNVGRITLDFCPELRGNSGTGIRDWNPPAELRLDKGGDLGCFEMGSTVVVVLDARWASQLRLKDPDAPVPMRMGLELSD